MFPYLVSAGIIALGSYTDNDHTMNMGIIAFGLILLIDICYILYLNLKDR